MPANATLDLVVQLKGDAARQLKDVGGAAEDAGRKGGILGTALGVATGGALLSGVGALTDAIGGIFTDGIEQSNQWSAAMAQTDAVIASTGGHAGVTKEQVEGLANSLSANGGLSTFADDAVASGENLLLTFTNIGTDVFPQATQTMLDMSAAMGTDMKGTAIQLGKALNDPIKGIGALSRVGVTFTQEQKDMIGTMVQAGDTAGAQGVIMRELGKEFGGSALAGTKTLAGQQMIMAEQFNNVKQTIGDALIPVLGQLGAIISSPAVMGAIQGLATGFASLISGVGAALPGILAGIGAALASIAPTAQIVADTVGAGIATAFQLLSAAATAVFPVLQQVAGIIADNLMPIGAGLATVLLTVVVPAFVAWATAAGTAAIATITALAPVLVPIAAVAAAVALLKVAWENNFLGIRDAVLPVVTAVVNALSQFWTTVQPLLVAAWNNIQTVVTTVWNTVSSLITAGMATLTSMWTSNWGGIQTIVSGVWTAIQGVVSAVWTAVSGIITAGLQVLSGDWSGAWTTIQNTLSGVWTNIQTAVSGGFLAIGTAITEFVPTATAKFLEVAGAFLNWVSTDVLPKIPDTLKGIWDAISGWVTQTAKDVANKVVEIGSAIINGIKQGVSDAWNSFVTYLSGLIKDALPQFIKDWLGISSPARIMVPIGFQIPAGLAVGIGKGAPLVNAAMGDLLSDLGGNFNIQPVPGGVGARFGGAGGGLAGGGINITVYAGAGANGELIAAQTAKAVSQALGLRDRKRHGAQ